VLVWSELGDVVTEVVLVPLDINERLLAEQFARQHRLVLHDVCRLVNRELLVIRDSGVYPCEGLTLPEVFAADRAIIRCAPISVAVPSFEVVTIG
jgi:hypothetical protein